MRRHICAAIQTAESDFVSDTTFSGIRQRSTAGPPLAVVEAKDLQDLMIMNKINSEILSGKKTATMLLRMDAVYGVRRC